jgi:mannosyltransferase OCH1-like enzyme
LISRSSKLTIQEVLQLRKCHALRLKNCHENAIILIWNLEIWKFGNVSNFKIWRFGNLKIWKSNVTNEYEAANQLLIRNCSAAKAILMLVGGKNFFRKNN